MSEDQQADTDQICADYDRLSMSALYECLDQLLAQVADSPQADELQRLLHELQVHQIELEIQNRELRETQQVLEETRDRYADLYDFAPVGYLTLDSKGLILDINLHCASMLGRERARLIDMPLVAFLAPGESYSLFEHLAQTLESQGQQKVAHEFILKSSAVSPIVVRMESIALSRNKSDTCTYRSVMIDVSTQKLTEMRLRQERDWAQRYLDTVEAIIVALDNDGCITLINRKGCELLGYGESELIGKNWFSSCLPSSPLTEQTRDAFRDIVAGRLEDIEYYENPIITRSGEERLVAWHNNFLYDDACKISGLLSAGEDITERRQTELALQSSSDYLQKLDRISQALASAPDLKSMLECLVVEMRQVYAVDRACLLYPCDPEAPSWEVMVEDSDAAYSEVLSENQEIPMSADFASIFRDAINNSGPVIYDFADDESAPEFVKRFNIQTQMVIALYPRIDKPWLLGMHSCSQHRDWSDVEKRLFQDIAVRAGTVLDSRLLRQKLEDDIAERRQAEKALKQSEQRFRVIFEQAAVGVAMIDSYSGKFQRVNQKYSDIIGYSIEEMLKLDFMHTTHPDDLPADLANMKKLLAGEVHVFEIEKRLIHKEGGIVWVKLTVSPMWERDEQPEFHIAIVQDISQRKLAEIVLDGRNEVLELMANGASLDKVLTSLVIKAEAIYPNMLFAVLVTQEQQGQFQPYTSPALVEFFSGIKDGLMKLPVSGYCSTAEFAGQRVLTEEVMTQPSCTACRDATQHTGLMHCWCEPVVSSCGETLGVFVSYSREYYVPTATVLEFIYGTARLASIAIERDYIEHKARQHQAELVHMARLNMMGEMATGMAHELNQPLAAIATYADVALRLLGTRNKQPELMEEALQGARQQALRASDIIRHLRQLVHKQAPQKVDVDINALIGDVLEFCRFELGKFEIHVTLELNQALPMVSVDSIQLEQVLLNLIRNSIEALQSISDKKREVIIQTALNNDGWMQVKVIDNGPGMSAATLDHLFVPFVTTKGAAGMGMGLSICRSIIESHGGRLTAESKSGEGATLIVTLPLHTQPIQE